MAIRSFPFQILLVLFLFPSLIMVTGCVYHPHSVTFNKTALYPHISVRFVQL